ncbi:hypothetical protein [Niveispirillum sp.]|uniref:hypothetical protein n=1 Tax=Niveispirillum sp. TaxID=1917217 RepID=UPI001B46C5BD|nr:hypothetical protein [Niveispirillum sp.]MBP7336436.1 hypothetical protein [Niveispirillum sp.]
MRQVLNDVTPEELPGILQRLGVKPGQRLRITLETLDEDVTLPGDEEEVAAFDWALEEVERA